MEEVARGVNEGRRRREVVKEVLLGSGSAGLGLAMSPGEVVKPKKKGLNLGVAASVSLGRMKNLRVAASSTGTAKVKVKEGAEASEEAEEVARLADELKSCEAFMRRFAKDAVEWADAVKVLTLKLQAWARSFGRVIWLSRASGGSKEDEEGSEAFDAFTTVVEAQLVPLCDELSSIITEQLLVHLTSLVNSTLAPSRLIEAMRTLEPLHHGLLNLNVAKSRPPPQLLDASQSYVALRAQLRAELPAYLALLRRGIAGALMHFAGCQAAYWDDVRTRWGALWEALKVDGERNAGAAETLRVWWTRFAEVEAVVAGLNIVRPIEKPVRTPKVNVRARG